MAEKIDVVVANPAGNTTILVLTRIPQERYAEVAGKLLQIDYRKTGPASGSGSPFAPGTFSEEIYRNEIRGEQVGFVLEDRTDTETGERIAAVDMSGMEFCGNAFRAFAYWKALESRPPLREVKGKMSGCEKVLTAMVDAAEEDCSVSMPLPLSVARYPAEQLAKALSPSSAEGVLVDLGGIAHLVLTGIKPSRELFEAVRMRFGSFPAFGLMFLDTDSDVLTPVVYVRDTGTTYFEGSCASGTTAAAVVRTMEKPDGLYRYSFRQPAGMLTAQVRKESGQIREIWLSGHTEFSNVIEVEM